MNRKEVLENIREQFKKMMFGTSPQTTGFTTTDGKNLIVLGEDVAVGVEIYQVDDNNVQSPLDNGDYTLTDGRVITVTDNKVENITAPDPAQATESPMEQNAVEMADGMPDGMPTDESPADVQEDTDTEARLSALEQQVQEILQMLQGTMQQTEKMMSSQIEMSETVKKIAEEPAGNKATVRKKAFTNDTSDISSKLDEIREIQKKFTQKGL